MRRRRLIVVAVVAVLAIGAMCWLSLDRLTPEERQLVGTWRRSIGSGATTITLDLRADRRWQERGEYGGQLTGAAGGGHWSARGGKLALNLDGRHFRRALFPLLRMAGLRVACYDREVIEIDGNRLVMTDVIYGHTAWTRAPAD